MPEQLSVADAKRRFSELIDRVQRGERFIVARRGKPAVALVPPSDQRVLVERSPRGLAAVAGSLGDWEDLQAVLEEIYAARRRGKDRAVPDLE